MSDSKADPPQQLNAAQLASRKLKQLKRPTRTNNGTSSVPLPTYVPPTTSFNAPASFSFTSQAPQTEADARNSPFAITQTAPASASFTGFMSGGKEVSAPKRTKDFKSSSFAELSDEQLWAPMPPGVGPVSVPVPFQTPVQEVRPVPVPVFFQMQDAGQPPLLSWTSFQEVGPTPREMSVAWEHDLNIQYGTTPYRTNSVCQQNNPFSSQQAQPAQNASSSFTFGQSQSVASQSQPAFGGGSAFQPQQSTNSSFNFTAAPAVQPASSASFGSQGVWGAQPQPAANGFGFGQSQPAQNSNTNGFSFGQAVNQPSTKGFGAGQQAQQNSSSFGASQQSTTPSTSFTFGGSQQPQQAQNPFANQSQSNSIAPTPFTFGAAPSQATTAAPSTLFASLQQNTNANNTPPTQSPSKFTFGATNTNSPAQVTSSTNNPFAKSAQSNPSNVFGGTSSPQPAPATNIFSFGKNQARQSEPPPSSSAALPGTQAQNQTSNIFGAVNTVSSNPFAALSSPVTNRQSEPPQSSPFIFSTTGAGRSAFASIPEEAPPTPVPTSFDQGPEPSTEAPKEKPAYTFGASRQVATETQNSPAMKPATNLFNSGAAQDTSNSASQSIFGTSAQAQGTAASTSTGKPASALFNFSSQSTAAEIPKAKATPSIFSFPTTSEASGPTKDKNTTSLFQLGGHSVTAETSPPQNPSAPVPAIKSAIPSQDEGVLIQTSSSKQNASAAVAPAFSTSTAKEPASAVVYAPSSTNIFRQSSLNQSAPPPSPKLATKTLSSADTVLPSIERTHASENTAQAPTRTLSDDIKDVCFLEHDELRARITKDNPHASQESIIAGLYKVNMRQFNANAQAFLASIPDSFDKSSIFINLLEKCDAYNAVHKPSGPYFRPASPPKSIQASTKQIEAPIPAPAADESTTTQPRQAAQSIFSSSTSAPVSQPTPLLSPNKNGKRDASSQDVNLDKGLADTAGHRAKQSKTSSSAVPPLSVAPMSSPAFVPPPVTDSAPNNTPAKGKRKADVQLTKDDPSGEDVGKTNKLARPGSETMNRFKNIIERSDRPIANGDRNPSQPETPAKANPFASLMPATAPAKTAPRPPATFSQSVASVSASSNIVSKTTALDTSSTFAPTVRDVSTTAAIPSFEFKPPNPIASTFGFKPVTGSSSSVNSSASDSGSFLAQFSAQAKKNAQEAEKKALQAAKDEDLDSDDDEEEFEANWRAERAAKLKAIEDSAAKDATFTVTVPANSASSSVGFKPIASSSTSSSGSFLSQFGQQAQKNAEEAEKKALQAAKDEDLDSDEDEEEFEANWRAKRAAEKKTLEEIATKGKGFSFEQKATSSNLEKQKVSVKSKPTETNKSVEPPAAVSAAPKFAFGQTSHKSTIAPKSDSIFAQSQPVGTGLFGSASAGTSKPSIFGQSFTSFAPPSRSQTSSPGSSVFDAQEIKKPVTFGTSVASSNHADDDSTDDEDVEEQENSDPRGGNNDRSDASKKEDANDEAITSVEVVGTGTAGQKKPSTLFGISSSTTSATTPSKAASSLPNLAASTTPKDSPTAKSIFGMPNNASKTPAGTQNGSSIFGAKSPAANPFAALNKTPLATTNGGGIFASLSQTPAAKSSPAHDQTWNQNTPIKFGTTSPSQAPTLLDAVASSSPLKPSSSPFAGFGNVATPKAGGLFAGVNADKAGSVGFSFGSTSTTSALQPPAAVSAPTSQSMTPAATAGNGSITGANNAASTANDPDAEVHAQIDLATSTAGEEEEDVLFTVKTKAQKLDVETKAWKVKGVGYFKLLKHKTTGAHRLLVRSDPSGIIILNKSMLKNAKYEVHGKAVRLTTADDTSKGLETWLLQVKTPASAEELAKSLNNAANS